MTYNTGFPQYVAAFLQDMPDLKNYINYMCDYERAFRRSEKISWLSAAATAAHLSQRKTNSREEGRGAHYFERMGQKGTTDADAESMEGPKQTEYRGRLKLNKNTSPKGKWKGRWQG